MRSRFVALMICGLALFGCRSDDDDKKWDGTVPPRTDGGGGGNEGGVVPGGTTIFQITSGAIKEGESVVLEDVIITAVDGYGKYTGDVHVQDPKGGPGSGLKLFAPERADGGELVSLKPGDHVKVEGAVKWFIPTTPFDDKNHPNKVHIKELEKPRITHLRSDTPPAPAIVTAKDLMEDPTAETWEGVLVQVQNVGVTAPVNPEYGEFRVTGNLPIDDDLFPGDPKLGDCLTITGISVYFYAFRLNPRSAADLQPGTGCPVPSTTTIKDIQDEKSAQHPAADSQVTVTGVVTAVDGAPYGDPPKFDAFWIQDGSGPFSGLAVHYIWDESTANKPKLGDTVEVTGTYVEYHEESQLDKVAFTSKGAGTLPAPEVIANAADIATGGSKAEQYEGVLVEVQNVEVESTVSTTGATPRVVGVKLKGSGLIVESDLYADVAANPPAAGTKYKAIRGVLRYTFSNFKIMPRSAADMEKL